MNNNNGTDNNVNPFTHAWSGGWVMRAETLNLRWREETREGEKRMKEDSDEVGDGDGGMKMRR